VVSQRQVERAVQVASEDVKKSGAQRVQRCQLHHVVERARRQAVGREALGARADAGGAVIRCRLLWAHPEVMVQDAEEKLTRAELRTGIEKAQRGTEHLAHVDDAQRRCHQARDGGGKAVPRRVHNGHRRAVPAARQATGGLLLGRIDHGGAQHGSVQRVAHERHKEPLAPARRRQTEQHGYERVLI